MQEKQHQDKRKRKTTIECRGILPPSGFTHWPTGCDSVTPNEAVLGPWKCSAHSVVLLKHNSLLKTMCPCVLCCLSTAHTLPGVFCMARFVCCGVVNLSLLVRQEPMLLFCVTNVVSMVMWNHACSTWLLGSCWLTPIPSAIAWGLLCQAR